MTNGLGDGVTGSGRSDNRLVWQRRGGRLGGHQLSWVLVRLVGISADLIMSEGMEKSGAGILFTVFGEPDVEIKTDERRSACRPSRRRHARLERRPGPQQ